MTIDLTEYDLCTEYMKGNVFGIALMVPEFPDNNNGAECYSESYQVSDMQPYITVSYSYCLVENCATCEDYYVAICETCAVGYDLIDSVCVKYIVTYRDPVIETGLDIYNQESGLLSVPLTNPTVFKVGEYSNVYHAFIIVASSSLLHTGRLPLQQSLVTCDLTLTCHVVAECLYSRQTVVVGLLPLDIGKLSGTFVDNFEHKSYTTEFPTVITTSQTLTIDVKEICNAIMDDKL